MCLEFFTPVLSFVLGLQLILFYRDNEVQLRNNMPNITNG